MAKKQSELMYRTVNCTSASLLPHQFKQDITKKEPTIKKAYGVAVMLFPTAGQLVLNNGVK